jgi:hypothetical protein
MSENSRALFKLVRRRLESVMVELRILNLRSVALKVDTAPLS